MQRITSGGLRMCKVGHSSSVLSYPLEDYESVKNISVLTEGTATSKGSTLGSSHQQKYGGESGELVKKNKRNFFVKPRARKLKRDSVEDTIDKLRIKKQYE